MTDRELRILQDDIAWRKTKIGELEDDLKRVVHYYPELQAARQRYFAQRGYYGDVPPDVLLLARDLMVLRDLIRQKTKP
jgi:hypothetical protein